MNRFRDIAPAKKGPVATSDLEERRKLKPEPGDIVRYGQTEYVVIQVGSKFVKVYERIGGNPRFPLVLHILEIVKTGEKA